VRISAHSESPLAIRSFRRPCGVAFLRYLPAQSAICVIIHATARATAYRVAIGCRRLAKNSTTMRLCAFARGKESASPRHLANHNKSNKSLLNNGLGGLSDPRSSTARADGVSHSDWLPQACGEQHTFASLRLCESNDAQPQVFHSVMARAPYCRPLEV
jgi:hypothetical protein